MKDVLGEREELRMAKALNGESCPQMRKAFMFKHLIDNVNGMVKGLDAIEKRCGIVLAVEVSVS